MDNSNQLIFNNIICIQNNFVLIFLIILFTLVTKFVDMLLNINIEQVVFNSILIYKFIKHRYQKRQQISCNWEHTIHFETPKKPFW